MSTLKVNKIRDTAGSADSITLDPNGGAVIAGVTTVSTVKVGSGVTISSDGDVFHTGVCTATSFVGNAANLTKIPAANIVGVATAGASAGGFSDLVKLQSANSTSAVSALEFQSLDVTTYRAFKFICSLKPATDEVVLYFNWLVGSSSQTSTAYSYILDGANGAGNAFRLANDENKVLICNNMGNGSLEGCRFELNLVPQVSGDNTLGNFGYGFFTYFDHNASHRAGLNSFTYAADTDVDGFKLYHNSGNVAAYNYVLYGVKR